MSEGYAGLDLGFCPSTKLFPMSAEKLLLSRVKGTARRKVLATAVDEDRLNELHPLFTRIALDQEERQARAAVHPSFMGGEYLPDFEEGEIEVARIDLRSVTADVISIRLRRLPEGFAYRVVDEYMDENVNGLLEEPTSLLTEHSLTLAKLGEFVVRTSRIQDICGTDRFVDVDEAQCFVRASSEFYPQFAAYIAAAIAAVHPDPTHEAEERSQ